MRIRAYSRHLRRNPLASLLIFGSLIILLLNESIVYYLKYSQWNKLYCHSEECTRILLVADPQILGETFDRNFYNGLAVQDSDRFLRKTFRLAVSHTDPHVIVFMGDLMDEGSVAKPDEFQRYVDRFKDVFYVPSDEITLMHISGDNDVGGETAEDSVTVDKVKRFREAFDEQGYVDVKNRLRLFNINQFTHHYPNVTKKDTPAAYYRVVVTHLSLLSFPGLSTEKVNHEIQPNVIFSAHQHSSRIITSPPIRIRDFNPDSSPISFDLPMVNGNSHLEIMVPTCSYRMGSPEMGYGYGIIGKDFHFFSLSIHA
ncbi:hypothetical protein HA402_004312 [Bradysia odoriphaga]|nr:hypothetical protein HA402_004312 [Bradysia odoriphaga]